jgi:hypothetical protein
MTRQGDSASISGMDEKDKGREGEVRRIKRREINSHRKTAG